MTQDRFIRENTPVWQALEQMLNGRQEKRTDFPSLTRLHRLYRMAAGHLSFAQTHFPESQLCQYLNALVTNAHHRLHIRRPQGWRSFGRLLTQGLPQMVRRNRAFVLVAIGVFLALTLYGYLFTWFAPDTAGAFLPQEYLDSAQSPGTGSWDGAVMSSTIMVNNIRVSILAFGLGLTCGLGTLYVLATNAMMLGALAAHVTAAGNGLVFWSLILPHGVWELFAICLSGAAGLRIGLALLRPGALSRKDALVLAGRQAVSLMCLVTVLLVLAGFVEGFFTPAPIAPEWKLTFSGVAFVLLAVYLFFGGRRELAR